MNPFLIKGYIDPKYFCNRSVETEKLISAVSNNQDVTLFAYRRMGKSALIHHAFHQLKKDYNCIYADLWGTTGVREFTQKLADAVIKSSVFTQRSMPKKMTDFIKSIGASISVGMDGMPSVDVLYHDGNRLFNDLEQIFNFLNKLQKPVVLAIDEFQEIRKYKEGVPLEAKLRSLTQFYANIRFVYSGSEHHLINEIFTTYNQPFYQSTRMMSLDRIGFDDYRDFVITHFEKGKKKIDLDVVDRVLQLSHRHTYYVQAIFNYLFSINKKTIQSTDFDALYLDFLLEKSVFYGELPQRMTLGQFACIKAIAKEGVVKSPTSGDFLQKVDAVKSTSSMQRIIKTLLEKQVVLKENDHYRLYDVFLEHYLRMVK